MAASATGVQIAHFTLSANTAAKIRLTGPQRECVDIIHNGDASNPIFYNTARTEAGLTTISAVKQAETGVITSGARLTFQVQPGTEHWFQFMSAGTPTVSVDGSQTAAMSSS